MTDWREIADDYLTGGKATKKMHTGRNWVTGVISIIWNSVYNNWEERIREKHGIDQTTREEALFEQVKRETEYLYLQRSTVLPCDQYLFYDSIQDHLKAYPTSRTGRQWLLTWGPTIRRSMKIAAATGIRHTRNIQDYFTRREP